VWWLDGHSLAGDEMATVFRESTPLSHCHVARLESKQLRLSEILTIQNFFLPHQKRDTDILLA
jgi:hypothetical protein